MRGNAMKWWIRFLWVFAMVFLFVVGTVWGADQPKKRVAVFDFEFGAVHQWWSGNWDIGKGISSMIVTNLVRDGTYSVIERQQLDKILSEQNFSNSDRANPATAAKIGKILGLNAIIIGTITEFGAEKKSIDAGAVTSRFGLPRVGTSSSKANVVLDARMVNTETAEIMAVASGKGQSSRGGVMLSGYGGGGAGGIDMGSSDFQRTIIGEATRQAVDELTRQLVSQSEKIEGTTIEINGLVADATDVHQLVLNIGKNQGLKVGDVVAIEHVVRTVKDPSDPSKILRTITERIGTAKITSVDAGSSMADFSGVGTPQVGDAIKAQ